MAATYEDLVDPTVVLQDRVKLVLIGHGTGGLGALSTSEFQRIIKDDQVEHLP